MLKVKDVMDKQVLTVSPEVNIKEICRLLIKNKLSGVPVTDKKGKLTGFVSERDIIAGVYQKDFLKKKVKDIMNKKVYFVKADMLTEEVARVFTDRPFRYLPVVRADRVVGIVSRKEVIERLLGQYY